MAKQDNSTDPVGKQVRCPECLTEIGTPETTHGQIKKALGRHLGSARCKENRRLIDHALAIRNQEREVVDETDTEDVIAEAAGVHPVVTFSSPGAASLEVLIGGGEEIVRHGKVVGHQPLRYAQFDQHHFKTSDPEIIHALRTHPANVEILKATKGIGASRARKDRFYEMA